MVAGKIADFYMAGGIEAVKARYAASSKQAA